MISRLFLLSILSFLFVLSAPIYSVHAADDEKVEKDEQFMSVHDRIKDLMKDFDELSEQHFYALYGSYNMIQVVEGVRGQVSGAVEKCIDANPDMKEALDTRYKEWDDALEPIVEDANANVDNMIAAQDYTKPRKIKKLLKYTDKMREEKSENLKKFPVTTPEACEYLRVKMDETQENLTALLQSTLVSLPQAMTHDIANEKAKQEEAARVAAEKEAAEKAKAEEDAKLAAEKEAAEKVKAEEEAEEKAE